MEQCWLNAWHELLQKKIQAWIECIPWHIEKIIRVEGNNTYKKGQTRKNTRDWKAENTQRLAEKLTKWVDFGKERGIIKIVDDDNNNVEAREISDEQKLKDEIEFEAELELKDKLKLEDELELKNKLNKDKLDKNKLDKDKLELEHELKLENDSELNDNMGIGNEMRISNKMKIGDKIRIDEDGIPSSIADAWQPKPQKQC